MPKGQIMNEPAVPSPMDGGQDLGTGAAEKRLRELPAHLVPYAMITIDEFALMLCFKRSKAWDIAKKSDEVDEYRFGRCTRISLASALAYRERQRVVRGGK
jgi:hypothetical protein